MEFREIRKTLFEKHFRDFKKTCTGFQKNPYMFFLDFLKTGALFLPSSPEGD